MDIHLLVLQLMAAQGILGAFDTLYHHELTEALPQCGSARKELSIHAIRSLIYSLLFIGLSAWQWHGFWAILLMILFAIEIILTLVDFVEEDKTRLLPATERVTHTILAINGGAFLALLAINMPAWFAFPTALVWQSHGVLSWFLALCGVGVGISGIRDALASYHLAKMEQRKQHPINFSSKSENILVTGATGFIGQALVKALVLDGHQVIVLTRNVKRAAWLFDGQVRCLHEMSELPITYPIDVIINLAGARILGWRWREKRKAVLRKSRVELTQNVVNWIQRAEKKPTLLLSASAIGYYGIQALDDNTALDETSASQPIFMSQLCQQWEASAQQASEYGVNVICLRFGLVLGQQGALPMMLLPIKLGIGGALGSGKQWLSWIHIYDVLRGIAHLMQTQRAYHCVNFTAPEVVSQKQFSQTAAKLLHRPCIFRTPSFPIRILLGEQSALLLDGQKVIPQHLLLDDFEFTYAKLKDALDDLISNAPKNH